MASYLQVENISKSYGHKVLFDNISFNINEGDKIALIALNGTGKTSMLRVLAGKESSDHGGQIRFMKNISIAFLEQDACYSPENTIFEEVVSRVGSKTQEQLWDAEIKAKQILSCLGFVDFEKKMNTLSGGEIKRVELAVVLVKNSDLIIMDEPTNHLDPDAIDFLEDYLKKSRRTLFLVTHDRYFLDRICNRILELEDGNLYSYKGNYSYYLEKREERIMNLKAENDKYRNLLRRELDWIRSTPCARTGKAKYRINAFYDLQDKAGQRFDEKKVNINVHTSRLGRKIIDCKNLSFLYGKKYMLKDFTYNFAQYEKIGVVGKNGVGKSTFVDLLTGAMAPSSGTIETGDTVKFGYYRQEGISFKEDMTVLETVREIAETVIMGDGNQASVTTFLQYFLFSPEMFNTKVEKLSGGEKRRLYLLTVLMRNPNVLILDEPTNDLDIVTLTVLEDYLQNFKGTVIAVSHDRFFLDKIADHLFIFTGDGKVKDFVGTYSEYRDYVRNEERAAVYSVKDSESGNKSKGRNSSEENDRKKLTYKEQKELEQLEKEIDILYSEKKELERELSSGTLHIDDLNLKSVRIGEIILLIENKENRWIELVS